VGDPNKPILVVEDNDDLRQAMRVLLQLEGYTVFTATDGQEALAALRSGLDPCLLILDLTMPSMNGYDFRQEQLQDERLARIPTIVCSGDGQVADKAHALGAAGFYKKPIEIEEFLQLVSAHC
jgi:two-component system response regulator MprA